MSGDVDDFYPEVVRKVNAHFGTNFVANVECEDEDLAKDTVSDEIKSIEKLPYQDILQPINQISKANFSKMVDENYKFFTKTVDKEKLYHYLFLNLDYKIIADDTFVHEFKIVNATSRKIFNFLLEYKVFEIEEEVIELNIDCPDERLYFKTVGLLSEDLMRKAKNIMVNERKFVKAL